MTRAPRRPAAFPVDELSRLDAGYVPGLGAPPTLDTDADPFAATAAIPVVTAASSRRRTRWVTVLLGALGGLVTLAAGLAVDRLIAALFARTDALGLLALGLAAVAAVALLALAVREILGLLRVRRIVLLQRRAAEAIAADDRDEARQVSASLIALYASRPETARGRAALAGHAREIIDGPDLIGLAERELLLGFDEAARRMVLGSAKRVAVVTAISPRALVDLVFVGAEILRLIRRLATLYGGRPGVLGFVRLARAAVTHLAVTGGMAAGDSIVQQILGHGIAARLSARLGEGVVNGLLTARVGIAAIEVCRPLPFLNGRPPRLADVMSELTRLTRAKS
ncbi:MAG TPA: TIGR01620 family protein [Bauldia sp.]|nr:TIGR01620 family protein [Bauldia sp.]